MRRTNCRWEGRSFYHDQSIISFGVLGHKTDFWSLWSLFRGKLVSQSNILAARILDANQVRGRGLAKDYPSTIRWGKVRVWHWRWRSYWALVTIRNQAWILKGRLYVHTGSDKRHFPLVGQIKERVKACISFGNEAKYPSLWLVFDCRDNHWTLICWKSRRKMQCAID